MYTVRLAEGCRYDWMIKVETLLEASKACRAFIKQHGLGSSTYSGGEVYDENHNMLYKVSYNGRVWDMEGMEVRIDDSPLAEEMFPSKGTRYLHPPKNIPFPKKPIFGKLEEYIPSIV